jgi:uncharacterized membrane protein
MSKRNTLKTILIISLAGLLFSGYLSYGELFAKTCFGTGVISCSAKPVGGIPACAIGFFMYLIVFLVSLWGVKSKE